MLETNGENLEWEILQKPLVVEKITPNEKIPKKSESSIVVNRTDSYQIIANLTAIQERLPLRERDTEYFRHFVETQPGSPLEPFTIEGSDQYGSRIELRNCFITKSSSCEGSGQKISTTLEIVVQEMKIEGNSGSEISWLSEWYLNGPDKILFPRNTERYQDEGSDKVSRKRVTIDISMDDALEVSVENWGHSRMDRDFAFIASEPIKFIIARVPNNFGPNWSKNICIEYRKDFGPIPDFEQREAISEIVSFVLGTQLLSVGITEYDSDGRTLKSVAKSSWGGSYSRFISENKQAPPFDLGLKSLLNNNSKIEELLCDLVPKYLVLRDKLNLKDALWKYWISRNMPIGTNLPVLSGALEIVIKSWFKSESSKSKAVHMPQKEFNTLLGEDFKTIEKKLDEFIEDKLESLEPEGRESRRKVEDIELKKPIMNKIRNSNQMSLTKKYPAFFKEIGLKTGTVEDEAIKARNSMAHGDKGNNEEFEKMIKCTRAYETLFHRVFLKILGYKGYYVDRSMIGYPEKHIDLPLGRGK